MPNFTKKPALTLDARLDHTTQFVNIRDGLSDAQLDGAVYTFDVAGNAANGGVYDCVLVGRTTTELYFEITCIQAATNFQAPRMPDATLDVDLDGGTTVYTSGPFPVFLVRTNQPTVDPVQPAGGRVLKLAGGVSVLYIRGKNWPAGTAGVATGTAGATWSVTGVAQLGDHVALTLTCTSAGGVLAGPDTGSLLITLDPDDHPPVRVPPVDVTFVTDPAAMTATAKPAVIDQP